MTTADLIRLARLRESVQGYRDSTALLLALADAEEREPQQARDAARMQAEADEELERRPRARRAA